MAVAGDDRLDAAEPALEDFVLGVDAVLGGDALVDPWHERQERRAEADAEQHLVALPFTAGADWPKAGPG